MNIYPHLKLVWLNGFLLILPMLAARFGIPVLLRNEALAELDYFPPVIGLERLALKVYFGTNTFLIFSPLLAAITPAGCFTITGWVVYLCGVVILTLSLVDFCRQDGFKFRGIYQYSRNPICMGYFIIFLGTALLISSWVHLILTAIYQIAVHWLILSEERWCLKEYGAPYKNYLNTVPRYFII